jgi:tryptophan synthase beta chain
MREDTKYALGSVLNHVLMHQTVIGQEAQKQLAMAGAYPDVVVGCVGGGSNFAGIAFPFVADAASGKAIRIVAAEPASCPTLTRGHYGYDFGDTAGMTPLLPMHTLGHTFMPAPIHSGGLRYHGMAPLVSLLVEQGIVEPVAYKQNECFAAGIEFARAEGIIPAPEATHAIRAVLAEVQAAKAAGESRTILFNLCGHGHLELGAYAQYLAGELVDHELEESALEDAAAVIAGMPSI